MPPRKRTTVRKIARKPQSAKTPLARKVDSLLKKYGSRTAVKGIITKAYKDRKITKSTAEKMIWLTDRMQI